MCANWIVSVGKIGAANAAGGSKTKAAPCRFDVASESCCKGPQWRFVAGGEQTAPLRNPVSHLQARHVLQDVLAQLTGRD